MEKTNKSRATQRLARKKKTPDSTATDRAYLHTKKMILQGSYQGGDLLSEGEVAHSLGVSRTPIREAFLRLEAEGLLRLYPKKGALIVPVSAREVEIVMETRRLIECYAIKKLTDRGPNEELAKRLEACADRQQNALLNGDANEFVEADRSYHASIIDSIDNPILSDLYHSLRDRQIRMGIMSQAYDNQRRKTIIEEHRRIAKELAEGNGPQGISDINLHLNGTLSILRGR